MRVPPIPFRPHLWASVCSVGFASASQAGFLGLSGTNTQVVDAGRRFSVIDVYADFTGDYDKLVNFYGNTSSSSLVRTSLNGTAGGIAFAQAAGSTWMPGSGFGECAWDSFVTIGSRSQVDAESLVQADPYFRNANAANAGTIVGGSNAQGTFIGAGWYTGSPSQGHVYAGTYADKRILLGRFSVETTGLSASDLVTVQFKGNLSMRVDGSSAGAGTILQRSVDQSFTYGFVPAPGVGATLAAVGVLGRGRRRR